MTPLIDDDDSPIDRDDPPSYDYSLIALQKIKSSYPEEFLECSLKLASMIDYAGATNGGVFCYQFNRIRKEMAAIQKKHGYPARMHHTVMFFDLLMFSVPFFTKLWVKFTMQIWDGELLPAAVLGNIIPLGESSDWLQERTHEWVWRKVIIYDIPDEVQNYLMDIVPFNIDNAIWDMVMKGTNREWYMIPNLLSLGGLHDKIIVCNWDLIKSFLNKHGK